MAKAKIAISLSEQMLEGLDRLVRNKTFANRSQAIEAAVEEKLRKAVSERHRRGGKAFRLRKATFTGKGLQSPLTGASWDRILEMSSSRLAI